MPGCCGQAQQGVWGTEGNPGLLLACAAKRVAGFFNQDYGIITKGRVPDESRWLEEAFIAQYNIFLLLDLFGNPILRLWPSLVSEGEMEVNLMHDQAHKRSQNARCVPRHMVVKEADGGEGLRQQAMRCGCVPFPLLRESSE